jgi:hypothetical protein
MRRSSICIAGEKIEHSILRPRTEAAKAHCANDNRGNHHQSPFLWTHVIHVVHNISEEMAHDRSSTASVPRAASLSVESLACKMAVFWPKWVSNTRGERLISRILAKKRAGKLPIDVNADKWSLINNAPESGQMRSTVLIDIDVVAEVVLGQGEIVHPDDMIAYATGQVPRPSIDAR